MQIVSEFDNERDIARKRRLTKRRLKASFAEMFSIELAKNQAIVLSHRAVWDNDPSTSSLTAVKTKAVGTFRRISHVEFAIDEFLIADIKEGMVTNLELICCDDDPFTKDSDVLTCHLKKIDIHKERENEKDRCKAEHARAS